MDRTIFQSNKRPKQRRLRWLTLVLSVAGVAGGLYAWHRHKLQKEVVHSPFISPFVNTRPEVRYVGSARCAECHTKEAATYAQHPMGRSTSPARTWLPDQRKAAASFEAGGLLYSVERQGDKVIHRETLPRKAGEPAVEVVAEIAFAVGSGRQGQSFLVNREGRVYQSPISWFVRDKRWNVSPGYAKQNLHFNRAVPESCLFCHANEARTDPDRINQYVPAALELDSIGCERCHGPGERHVEARLNGERKDDTDWTIVNPRRLEPSLREAVCQQCHLQGEATIVRAGKSLWDYRPGLPLEEFQTVFVHQPSPNNSRKAVNHVEQMYLSRCFTASAGKLGCISCHDPHVLPDESERVAWYRGRCLTCHQETSCSLSPHERRRHHVADSCIECHMPRGDSSNVAHASITDHRIIRHAVVVAPSVPDADHALIPFRSGASRGDETQLRRDEGMALALQAETAVEAWRLLKPAVERVPNDVPALESLGLALWRGRRAREAVDVLEKALAQAPEREMALHTAALAALEAGQTEHSLGYWQRLLRINPYDWESQAFLGQTLAHRGRFADAIEACRESLRLDPFETKTRMLQIDCLMRLGEKRRASAEFDVLMALYPPKPDDVRQWFEDMLRASR